eukprot:TRINITY_DN136_c0_g1_i3.p1 TRINITY_DN136_c0_g1~~TRINITY_DN136_c0_g1_i3.p1  ORF type:complete len:311 (-),score=45.64 TRINITY_DN136_c0_g1_i3:458-1390(-)
MATNHPTPAPIEESMCVTIPSRSRSQSVRGYRKDLLQQEPPSVELVTCPICEGILRDALVLDGKTTCRNCCENEQKAVPSAVMRKSIFGMNGTCPFSKYGCEWIGQLLELELHIKGCEYSSNCPFLNYGCQFQSQNTNEMTQHKTENEAKHYEMRMTFLENENFELKQRQNYLQSRLSVLLGKGKISKFIESIKMCLEGVEWRLDGEQIGRDGNELLGPDFYLRGGYHLQLEGKKEENQVLFRVRRIVGEFDRYLSSGRLTRSSIDQLGREKTTNNTHNLKLDVEAVSEVIHQARCTPSVHRFYFHIDLI